MISVTDLKFKYADPSPNAPIMTCNNCGKKVKMTNETLYADHPLTEDSHVTFFICSSACAFSFHLLSKREIVNRYINDVINKVKKRL